MEQAKAVPIAERLREIKIGGYTVDNGSHSKHFAVRPVCEEAAAEIERANEHEQIGKGRRMNGTVIGADTSLVWPTQNGSEKRK